MKTNQKTSQYEIAEQKFAIANPFAFVKNSYRLLKLRALAMLLFILCLFDAVRVEAQTDATAITTAANSAFVDIATLCVAIGTFFVVYRLVRKIR